MHEDQQQQQQQQQQQHDAGPSPPTAHPLHHQLTRRRPLDPRSARPRSMPMLEISFRTASAPQRRMSWGDSAPPTPQRSRSADASFHSARMELSDRSSSRNSEYDDYDYDYDYDDDNENDDERGEGHDGIEVTLDREALRSMGAVVGTIRIQEQGEKEEEQRRQTGEQNSHDQRDGGGSNSNSSGVNQNPDDDLRPDPKYGGDENESIDNSDIVDVEDGTSQSEKVSKIPQNATVANAPNDADETDLVRAPSDVDVRLARHMALRAKSKCTDEHRKTVLDVLSAAHFFERQLILTTESKEKTKSKTKMLAHHQRPPNHPHHVHQATKTRTEYVFIIDPPLSCGERLRDKILWFLDHDVFTYLGVAVLLLIVASGGMFFLLLVGAHLSCRPSLDCQPRNRNYNLAIQILNGCFTYMAAISLPWRLANLIHTLGIGCPYRSNAVGRDMHGRPTTDAWYHLPLRQRLGVLFFLMWNALFQFANQVSRIEYNTYEEQATGDGPLWTNLFFVASMACAAVAAVMHIRYVNKLKKEHPGAFGPGPLDQLRHFFRRRTVGSTCSDHEGDRDDKSSELKEDDKVDAAEKGECRPADDSDEGGDGHVGGANERTGANADARVDADAAVTPVKEEHGQQSDANGEALGTPSPTSTAPTSVPTPPSESSSSSRADDDSGWSTGNSSSHPEDSEEMDIWPAGISAPVFVQSPNATVVNATRGVPRPVTISLPPTEEGDEDNPADEGPGDGIGESAQVDGDAEDAIVHVQDVPSVEPESVLIVLIDSQDRYPTDSDVQFRRQQEQLLQQQRLSNEPEPDDHVGLRMYGI